MKARKILTILAVLVMTFVSCFATGCGKSANIGGYNDEQVILKAQEKLAKFAEATEKYGNEFSVDANSKVIDIKAEGFTPAEFGTYKGTGEEGSAQETYMAAVIEAAMGRKISKGTTRYPRLGIVLVNYGTRANDKVGYFMYMDDGRTFVHLNAPKRLTIDDTIFTKVFYEPTGYRLVKCNHTGNKYSLRLMEKVVYNPQA